MTSTVEGRVVRLSDTEATTLEQVDDRRLQLWVTMSVVVLAITVGMVAVTAWNPLPDEQTVPVPVVQGSLVLLVAAFCAYAIDKELRLRRLGRHLMSERVLVMALANRLQELSSLLDAGKAMNAVLDLTEVLRRILDNALELLDATDGSVLLHEPPDVLRTVCSRGNDIADGSVVRLGEGVAGGVAATCEPVLVHGELVPGARVQVSVSAMSVPLVHRGELMGVLNVNGDRTFDEYDLRALGLFGEHAASAIATARLHEADRANAIALAHSAYHDELTGLGNRSLFVERVGSALAVDSLRPVAVLLFDVDDFKRVNDTLGHRAGDELLRRVAGRLRRALGEETMAARLGGDEFGVLLAETPTLEEAERIRRALSGPLQLDAGTTPVQVSAGVAVGVPGVHGADELLRDADVAMYIAKGQGKGCARLFEPGMHAALVERIELEAELAVAVERAELELYYQPVVSLQSGRVCGFEALLRWNHPVRGQLPPEAFLPLAEETGLVIAIDRWALLKACCRAAAWQHAYPSDERLVISVNLSASQLADERVADVVALALEVSELDPADLVIEITERFVVLDRAAAVERLEELRALGIRIGIDDFGTGYTSLSFLRDLPVQVLKIGRTFVDGLGRGSDDEALVSAIVRLAASLDMETIAEGVERPQQRAVLADLGCDLAQGWHFSRPLTMAEMEDLLGSRVAALPANL